MHSVLRPQFSPLVAEPLAPAVLAPRGVHEEPYRAPNGGVILYALTSTGRLLARCTVTTADEYDRRLVSLRRLLDFHDPISLRLVS